MRIGFRQNVGGLDRQLRLVIGIALSIIFVAPAVNVAFAVRAVALVISGVLVFTGISGY